MRQIQTANYAMFVALMISTALGVQSLWGILFLFWVILSTASGQAFLLTEVARAKDPILFWCIQVAWLVLGVLMIAADFFPSLAG